MEPERDINGYRFKCGPNWVPDWIYNEPLFEQCCKTHDIAWTEGRSKCCSDVRLLRCCWSKAGEEVGWWKIRARMQAVLMYSILLLNPISYVMYFVSRCRIFRNHG